MRLLSTLLLCAALGSARGEAIVTGLAGHDAYIGTAGQASLYVSHLNAGSTVNQPTILVGTVPCDIQTHTSTAGRLHCITRPVDLHDVVRFGLPLVTIDGLLDRGFFLPLTVVTSSGEVATCQVQVRAAPGVRGRAVRPRRVWAAASHVTAVNPRTPRQSPAPSPPDPPSPRARRVGAPCGSTFTTLPT